MPAFPYHYLAFPSFPAFPSILSLLLLFIFIFIFPIGNGVHAGTLSPGAPCSPAHDHLDLISHKFVSQCGDLMFCQVRPQSLFNILNSTNDTVNPNSNALNANATMNEGDANENINIDGNRSGNANTNANVNTNGTCVPRLCRRDEFPFGYDHEEDIYGADVLLNLPTMCVQGTYCPDEGSGCEHVLTPGEKCQMGRDEQCSQQYQYQYNPGSDVDDVDEGSSASMLNDNSNSSSTSTAMKLAMGDRGVGVGVGVGVDGTEKVFQIPSKLHANELGADELKKNGTGSGESEEGDEAGRVLCLLEICTIANIPLNKPCISENTTYASYDTQGILIEYNIYRDNCLSESGLFCGVESRRCECKKEIGGICGEDFECFSFNCIEGMCTRSPETPYVVAPWQYALTVLTIVGATASTFTILMLLHKRHRARRYREIGEYYDEQLRFRNAIIALHTSAAQAAQLDMLVSEADIPLHKKNYNY